MLSKSHEELIEVILKQAALIKDLINDNLEKENLICALMKESD